MTEQPVGPRCGNNPNVQLTPGDRKAVAEFKARLALKAAAKPYIDRAVWVDGDPLMEVIAVTVWEHCARDDQEMPQAVCDDPRTIAAFAAAVARAHAALLPEPTNRAAECPQCGDTGACNGGPCPLRRMADEAQQPAEVPCCSDPTCTCNQVNAAGRCDCAKWESGPAADEAQQDGTPS